MTGRGARFVVWGLAVGGILARLRQYGAARSLWLDEAQLVNGVVSRSAWQLVTEALPSDQVAPPGFVLLMHASMRALGATESAARLVPLLAGIATVLLAVVVAGRLFATAAARVAFVALVAGAPALVYYSVEAKQYGLDPLTTLGAIALAASPRVGPWLLAVAGSTAVWLSHTAPLALLPLGLTRLAVVVRERRWTEMPALVGVGVAWLASFGTMYAVTAISVVHNPTLARYWRTAFAPAPCTSDARAWYGHVGRDTVGMAFLRAGPDALAPGLWWRPWLDVVVLLGAGAGLIALGRRHAATAVVSAGTLLTALGASAAHRYPLDGRLLLFGVPIVFLGLAAGIDALTRRGDRTVAVVPWMLTASVVGLVAGPMLAMARHPLRGSDVKGALAYVETHARPGDRLALSAWSVPAATFHARQVDLHALAVGPRVPASFDAAAFLRDVRRAGVAGRTWIVLSHRFDRRATFLGPLRRVAPLLEQWEGNGAGAYLVDLPPPPRVSRLAEASPSTGSHP